MKARQWFVPDAICSALKEAAYDHRMSQNKLVTKALVEFLRPSENPKVQECLDIYDANVAAEQEAEANAQG